MRHLKDLLEEIGSGWCRIFHPLPKWPIHGHYQCPKCLRIHPVLWEQGSARPITPGPCPARIGPPDLIAVLSAEQRS